MADQNPSQAKPAQQQAAKQPVETLSRRDQFVLTFGAAILHSQPNATPTALKRKVDALVDAFLAELDK